MAYFVDSNGMYIGCFASSDCVPFECFEITTCPECVNDVYIGGEWIRGVSSSVKAINSLRDSLIESGYTSGGYTYQIREIDIANFDRMLVAFNDGRTNPHGGQWATKDNTFVSLDDSQMKELAIAATTYRDAILRGRSIHVYAVSKMTDEQANDYDIDAGWPANGV